MVIPVEQTFSVSGYHLTAQTWGESSSPPIIALHGWLDNAASFALIAPILAEKFYVVALDLAGHGQSSHRPVHQPYHLWDDVADILAIADQQSWETFSILGHSRGAMIGFLLAGAMPRRVSCLALLDGIWPKPVNASAAPEQLASSLLQVQAHCAKKPKIQYDLAIAIEARAKGRFPVSEFAAGLLVERGIRYQDLDQPERGFYWSTDSKLLAASALKLSELQIRAFAKAIASPVLLIKAKQGLWDIFYGLHELTQVFQSYEELAYIGGHHLHMDGESQLIANDLKEWLDTHLL